MNHFQNTIAGQVVQHPPQPKRSCEAAPPVSLSQAELRDIVIALLG